MSTQINCTIVGLTWRTIERISLYLNTNNDCWYVRDWPHDEVTELRDVTLNPQCKVTILGERIVLKFKMHQFVLYNDDFIRIEVS